MDYQGNTRKEREKSEKKQKPAESEKNLEKIVTGEVVQKPKSTGRKFKEVFLGGDAKLAAGYVLWDVLLPAMRNAAFDVIKGYAERVIYGESRYRSRPTVNYRAQYQGGTEYTRRFDPRDPIRDPREQAYPTTSRVRQNRHEINDIVIPNKDEADLVVERMSDILDKYEVVSLADLYAILGLETSHIDFKWGWRFLGNIQVRQIRQGYLLELPALEEI